MITLAITILIAACVVGMIRAVHGIRLHAKRKKEDEDRIAQFEKEHPPGSE